MTLRFAAPEAVDDDPVVPLDLRLGVAATAWWVGTLAAIRLGWAGAWWVAVVAAAGLGVALAVRRPGAARVAAVVLLCAVAAAIGCSLRLSAIRDSPAFALAAGHRSGSVELTVAGGPSLSDRARVVAPAALLPGADAVLAVDGRRFETGTGRNCVRARLSCSPGCRRGCA